MIGPELQFASARTIRCEEWDNFVCSVPGAHFEQVSGWAALKSHYGWDTLRIIGRRQDGKIVGGIQVLTRKIKGAGTIGYVARGPVVAEGGKDISSGLVEEMSRIARKEWWLYNVIDYPYHAHELAGRMASRGYEPHLPGIPPSGLLSATALVGLEDDLEAILGRMKANVRRDIRRGERSGLEFVAGSESDLERFRELMCATCARRGTAPTPPQRDFFINLWREMAAKGWVQVFLVKKGAETIAAAVVFTLSDTVRVWKVGWSGEHGQLQPNRFMWWEIMKWAKARGFRKLDCVWVDTEDAIRIARGDASDEQFRDGTTYFKMSFGASLHFPPPVQCYFFNPVVRLAIRGGGRQLLKSALFQRTLARYWSKAGAQ